MSTTTKSALVAVFVAATSLGVFKKRGQRTKQQGSEASTQDAVEPVTLDRAVRTGGSQAELYDDIKRASVDIYAPWREAQRPVEMKELKIVVVSGGITNQLYRVTLKRDGSSVLFRVFGARTELIINRTQENFVCGILTRNGVPPLVYGHVKNGRVEQWLDGHTLEPEAMKRAPLQAKIAAKLAEMHASDIPLRREAALWKTLDEWLDVALGIEFEKPERQAILEEINLPRLRTELATLRKQLDQLKSPLVFAHNDLLSGNIIYDPEADRMTFIDFEYCNYNPRGFDIANHFCETVGFECDFSKFPTPTEQRAFHRAYLRRWKQQQQQTSGDGNDDDTKQAADVSDEEVEQLFFEVSPYALASHLFWGIWGIVQAKHSPIDFDFLSYAKSRVTGYYEMKNDCLADLDTALRRRRS